MAQYQAPGSYPAQQGKPWWVWALIGCGGLTVVGGGMIAILAAILFPVFAQAREKARQSSCSSNVKQIAQGLLIYAQDNQDRLPPAAAWSDAALSTTRNPGVFRCPSDRGADGAAGNRSSYAFNSGQSRGRLAAVASPGQTPMLFESSAGRWNAADPLKSFTVRHMKLGVVGYMDGHVKMEPAPPAPR